MFRITFTSSVFTLSKIDEADDDDDGKSDEFGGSDDYLQPGDPFHIATVDHHQQTCNTPCMYMYRVMM